MLRGSVFLVIVALASGAFSQSTVADFNEDVDALLARIPPTYKVAIRQPRFIELVSPAATPTFIGIYQRMLLIEGAGPRIRLEAPDCGSGTISTAIPEETGKPPMLDLWGNEIKKGHRTFHYNQWAVTMSPEDAELYCKLDWSDEIEALRQMQLKGRGEGGRRPAGKSAPAR